MAKKEKKEERCCPEFDPKTLDEKIFEWKDKPFIKDIVKSFMHVPLNVGKVMAKMWQKVEDAKAAPEEFLALAFDPTPWKSEQYIAVTKEVPGAENVTMSGTFLTKVFEGPYREAKNWHDEMIQYVGSKGKVAKKIYFYYTTCPKCAKAYGKNYVVAFAEV